MVRSDSTLMSTKALHEKCNATEQSEVQDKEPASVGIQVMDSIRKKTCPSESL